jgi:protein SCO1/2
MKSTLVALAVLMLTLAAAAQGHGALSADQLRDRVSFEPVAGASMPLNAAFTDERGRSLPLQGWLAARPTFLALVYFDCDDLCSIVEQNLLSALRTSSLRPGLDYSVVLVSLASQESSSLAADRKRELLAGDEPGEAEAWHFLTGSAESIDVLTRAAGLRYASVPDSDRIAHPAGILLLSPPGRIAQYFPGVDFRPDELRHAVIDASAGRAGSFSDRVWLLCHRYDPSTGHYSPLISAATRALGATTLLALALLIIVLWRNDRALRRGPR